MQWTPGPQAGFSANPHTWLPIPPSYKSTNVQTEQSEPNSQLAWFEALITLRRSNPALHDGSITMLDTGDPNVLAYARSAGDQRVVVAMNFAAQPRTISLDLQSSKVTTLLTDAPALRTTTSLKSITLPPFASWVASVQ